MKLSIIIPAFNEAKEIAPTVRSAMAAGRASGCAFEVIVVDDASTDGTADLARQAGAKVHTVCKRQIGAVRNAGAGVADGDVLVFIDADTHVPPVLLAQVAGAVRGGAVAGGTRIGFDADATFGSRIAVEVWNFLSRVVGWAAGSFLFSTREAFAAVGGFDERYFAAEEIVISEKLKRQGRLVILEPRAMTSSRKERTHGPLIHLIIMAKVILTAGRALQSRDGLTVWYDGKR